MTTRLPWFAALLVSGALASAACSGGQTGQADAPHCGLEDVRPDQKVMGVSAVELTSAYAGSYTAPLIWQVPKNEGVHPSDQITIAFTYGGATARAGCVFIVPVDVTVTIRDAGIDRTDVGNLTSYDESHDQVDLDFQSDRLFISATLRRMETGVAISGSVHLIDDQSETYASFNRAAGP